MCSLKDRWEENQQNKVSLRISCKWTTQNWHFADPGRGERKAVCISRRLPPASHRLRSLSSNDSTQPPLAASSVSVHALLSFPNKQTKLQAGPLRLNCSSVSQLSNYAFSVTSSPVEALTISKLLNLQYIACTSCRNYYSCINVYIQCICVQGFGSSFFISQLSLFTASFQI